jgi:hypothetical protein
LLRAPQKEGSSSLLNPSILFPLLAVLATGDAASGIIDPSLPQFLSAAAVVSLAVGATLNAFVFPQLNQVRYSYVVFSIRFPSQMIIVIEISSFSEDRCLALSVYSGH